MQTEDSLNVWSSALYNQGGVDLRDNLDAVPSTGSAIKIISGRVAVHSISVSRSTQGNSSAADFFNSRAYRLCSSSTLADIACKFLGMRVSSYRSLSTSNIEVGGNGILFEDGVYLAADATAPDGSSTAKDTGLALNIFYTGGANT
tara:strand:+ start:3870 stop:4307 length:438 start_codon:yes stop_codon:yes gene_type:complete